MNCITIRNRMITKNPQVGNLGFAPSFLLSGDFRGFFEGGFFSAINAAVVNLYD
jgi:hypothetical protein